MTRCNKCDSEVTELIGVMFTQHPTQKHTVDIHVCDCWMALWDATKQIGFEAEIRSMKKSEEGKFVDAENIHTLNNFR